jgi:hypothetical protein
MKIGGLFIGWPHRGTWRNGICFEWGDRYGNPPERPPHCHFVRIYVQ